MPYFGSANILPDGWKNKPSHPVPQLNFVFETTQNNTLNSCNSITKQMTFNMKHIKWQWVAKGIFFGLLLFFVFTGATMLLWNAFAAPLFGLPTLDLIQTAGLMLLGRLLTGGFARGGWRGGRSWRMRKGMRERWQNMTEEEREQVMQRWGKHRSRATGETDMPPTEA